ncbi:ABC transporter substrate-binding protein [Leptospira interrogans]
MYRLPAPRRRRRRKLCRSRAVGAREFKGLCIGHELKRIGALIGGDVLGKQTYDPEKAKKVFAEARHPNGFTVNLWVLLNPSTRRTAEILVAQLSQVGVTVNLEALVPG